MQIDDDLVRSQLIINQSIEQMVLIGNPDDAYNVLFQGATRPRNIKAIFSFAARRGAGVRLRAGQGGEPASDPVSAFNGRARMKTDVEAQIR